MSNNRDDFTKKTVDILGRRVGFRCSNPDCRKSTVGPNLNDEMFTVVGIASHITAATPGGPRFDDSMSREERKHISNGIWLCPNCSVLIDKDSSTFSKSKLLMWKGAAESEARGALNEKIVNSDPLPFIEADLIWTGSSRRVQGYSSKNFEKYEGRAIPAGDPLVIHYDLVWHLSMALYNNSEFHAYNIQIEHVRGERFTTLTELPRINNLPALGSIDLEAKYYIPFEGEYPDADKLLAARIPKELFGSKYQVTYLDDNRMKHSTIMEVENGEIMNSKE